MEILQCLVPMGSRFTVDNAIHSITGARNQYFTKLEAYGMIPIGIPSSLRWETFEKIYGATKGIFFTGGSDVDPGLYRHDRHPKTNADDPVRDRLEKELILRAIEDGMPLLAVCHGNQMLAVSTDGTLHQHLPDLTDEFHGDEKIVYGDDRMCAGHDVILVPGSRLSGIMGVDRLSVPGCHHQAIDDPGAFEIVGTSPEGYVEAVELRGHPFCIGIQGHIELSNKWDRLFAAFGEAMSDFARR